MLKGVSESARSFSQAFSYVPDTGALLAGKDCEFRLDGLIAEGGEGKVFEIKGRDEYVAKVYKEVDSSRKEKLKLMAQRGNRGLRKVCAWPISPLSDSNDETVGFVMENLVGWKPLHNVYQIRSRLKLLPHHGYSYLVRTARNLATCVHHLHEEGIVIGDLNESNVFVDGKAMVKLIDADSFQIAGPTALYPCRVGKAELMPPELQGQSLEGILRTPEHDRFGLAVLIFQTLVFGRHPFSGTTAHHLDLTLEACIEHGYYAYTAERETPVKPPPNLTLDWLPPNVRQLFAQAFDPHSTERPSAKAWYFAMKDLEASLRTCSENPSHQYWSKVGDCPWCKLEDIWRIALFKPTLTDPDQEYEVAEILQRIATIPIPANSGKGIVDFDYRSLSPAKLRTWEALLGRTVKNWGWFLFCFGELLFVTLTGRPAQFLWIFFAGIMLLGVFAFIFGRPEWAVSQAKKRLNAIGTKWRREANPDTYVVALTEIQAIANDLRDVRAKFERDRQAYVRKLHIAELEKYLRKSSIHFANAGSVSPDKLSRLGDSGIKTAADLTIENLNRIPQIMPSQERSDLMQWRYTLESQFWKSHNYKLTIHQERNLILETRKENDRKREQLERAPEQLEELANTLRARQEKFAIEAQESLAVIQQHGPKLLAIDGRRAG